LINAGIAGFPMNGPDPAIRHPLEGFTQVCFLQNVVSNPLIEIGAYTYYDDPDGAERFEQNVLYHFPFIGDRLVIGKFCAIARGVKFLMNGANHKLSGFSSYPFFIFGRGWETVAPAQGELPYKGDTVVGNDVWIGYDSLIMPGVRIGDGSIIGARSMVTRDVPPYSIVGGNPAEVIRARFDSPTTEGLLRIRWWDWDAGKITRNLAAIVGADLAALERDS
jgi:virginiamycin A acetyltransferase